MKPEMISFAHSLNVFDEDWTRDFLEKHAAAVLPGIVNDLAAHPEAGPQAVGEFKTVAEFHLRENVIPRIAPLMAQTLNRTIEHLLKAMAVKMGEKTIVTKHDDRGRIVEFVRVPMFQETDGG